MLLSALQENQAKLFKEIIQFSPGKLQGGGGSGLGLYSKFQSPNIHGVYGNLNGLTLILVLFKILLINAPLCCVCKDGFN